MRSLLDRGSATSTLAVLGVDVGGTTIKGELRKVGSTVSPHRERISTTGNGRTPLESLMMLTSAFTSIADSSGIGLASVCVAAPGVIDSADGVVRFAANLGWKNLPLVALLQGSIGPEVLVEVVQDAQAGALAEGREGAAVRIADFAYVPIGTGLGGVVVINGAPVLGASGSAGEIGHLVVVPGGERCTCGQLGCAEAYASGWAIEARYRALTGRTLTAMQSWQLVDRDDVAESVWRDAADAIARALAAIISVMDPPAIILGGGISLAGPRLLSAIRARLEVNQTWREPPQLLLGALGVDAGTRGAAIVAADNLARED